MDYTDLVIQEKHYFLEPLRTAIGLWGLRMFIFLVVTALIILYVRLIIKDKKKGSDQ